MTAPSPKTKIPKSLCELTRESSGTQLSFDARMSFLRPMVTEWFALQKNNFFAWYPGKKGIKAHFPRKKGTKSLSWAQRHFSLQVPGQRQQQEQEDILPLAALRATFQLVVELGIFFKLG